jgi:hypothetical protein
MWFLLFATGAVLLGAFGLPAARRLPVAPPPEALVAAYFLVAALVRLLVRDYRLASFERKARKLARRAADKAKPTVLGELGAGVGRGALQAVGGDLLGAGLSLASALLRGAASSVSAPPPAPRERRRAGTWERVKALGCVAGVGLVCAGVAWEPVVRGRWRRAADAAAVAAGITGGEARPVAARAAPPARRVVAAAALPGMGAASTAAAAAAPTATSTATSTATPIATSTATATSTPIATSTPPAP